MLQCTVQKHTNNITNSLVIPKFGTNTEWYKFKFVCYPLKCFLIRFECWLITYCTVYVTKEPYHHPGPLSCSLGTSWNPLDTSGLWWDWFTLRSKRLTEWRQVLQEDKSVFMRTVRRGLTGECCSFRQRMYVARITGTHKISA